MFTRHGAWSRRQRSGMVVKQRALDDRRVDRERRVDLGLSVLLVLQGFTLFVAIPLDGGALWGRVLLDGCHLAFAVVCIGVLTRHRAVQVGLLLALVVLVGGPAALHGLGAHLRPPPTVQHEAIAAAAFAFNAGVTALVARNVFAPGQVTVHRVRGAILLYLNVAALFAIAYGFVAMSFDGAFAWAAQTTAVVRGAAATARFSYFSLATITTTGYGDVVPVHPLARSLANLEAVFGQLFPATLLARLVSQHLRHEEDGFGGDTRSAPARATGPTEPPHLTLDRLDMVERG